MNVFHSANFECLDIWLDENDYFPYANEMIDRAFFLLRRKERDHLKQAGIFLDFMLGVTKVNFDHEVAIQCSSAAQADDLETSSDLGESVLLQMLFEESFQGPSTATYALPEFLFEGALVPWRKYELTAVVALSAVTSAMYCCDIVNGKNPDWRTEIMPFISEGKYADEDDALRKLSEFASREAWRLSLICISLIKKAERMREKSILDVLETRRKSRQGRSLNSIKHHETYIAKKKVLLEWENKRTDFASASKAGLYFHGWLTQNGLKQHEPSTITKWIRDAAKEKGIRLR